MKTRLVWIGSAFAAGLLLGVVLTVLMVSDDPAVLEGEARDLVNGPAVETPNASLLARIKEQETELARLRAAVKAQPTEAMAASVENESETETEPPRRPGILRRIEERMSRRVDELVANYGLTADQRIQVEEIYRKRMENFRARRQGEAVEPFNLDAAIEGVLTEEQFSDYLEDSQEEIYNRAELMATSQLVRLRQVVEVSPEQEPLVYDAIHYTAQEMMIARQTGEDFDMRAVMDERLGTILTEEQMSVLEDGFRGPGPGFRP